VANAFLEMIAAQVSCLVCGIAGPSKYKCPTCRAHYCSVPCYRSHKEEPCFPHKQEERNTPEELEGGAPAAAAAALRVIHKQLGAAAAGGVVVVDQPTRPKRPFEEDTEDEDGARLRRKHLFCVATNDTIREALSDRRLVATVTRIDAAARAEQALDTACEDPAFREFTEKVLNLLASEPKH